MPAGTPIFPEMRDTYYTSEQFDNSRVVKKFYNGSAAAIPDGTAVMTDLSVTSAGIGQAIKIAANTDGEFAGIADAAIAIGDWGFVVTKGIKTLAIVDSAVAAGDLLQVDATDGELIAAGAGTERIVGVALTAYSGGTATVKVGAI